MLRLHIDVPHEARLGQPVPIVLRAENAADYALDLYLRGREIAFDVVVTDSGVALVWRRLEGEIIPAIIQVKTLAPRETLELRATWDQRTNAGQRVGAGLYSVRGSILTDASPVESAIVELRILG